MLPVIVVAIVVLSGFDAEAAIDEPGDASPRIDAAAPGGGMEGLNGIAIGFVCCSLAIIRVVLFEDGSSIVPHEYCFRLRDRMPPSCPGTVPRYDDLGNLQIPNDACTRSSGHGDEQERRTSISRPPMLIHDVSMCGTDG